MRMWRRGVTAGWPISVNDRSDGVPISSRRPARAPVPSCSAVRLDRAAASMPRTRKELVVRRGILTPYWGLSASKIDPPGFVIFNTPRCLDRRGGGDAGCGDDCADPSGSSGEGRTDQEDRPGFEGFEEHGAQGGSGRFSAKKRNSSAAAASALISMRPRDCSVARSISASEQKQREEAGLLVGAWVGPRSAR